MLYKAQLDIDTEGGTNRVGLLSKPAPPRGFAQLQLDALLQFPGAMVWNPPPAPALGVCPYFTVLPCVLGSSLNYCGVPNPGDMCDL